MKRRLLVADGSAANREALCALLADEYDVLEARDGREALDLVNRHCKSLSAALLALSMPDTDGYAVLGAARSNALLRQLPLIATDDEANPNAELRALALGATDYFARPFNAEIVRRRVANVIRLRESAAVANALEKDELTGLFNRKTFLDRVGALVKARPAGYFVISCFNINRFKVINDQYGSRKGDEVLRQIADVFYRTLRHLGGECCRIMADNFALLYPAALADSPEMERLWRDLATLDGSLPPITFNVGRYVIDDLKLAPSAMYDRAAIAESSVKGRFDARVAVYDDSMRQKLLREQEIVTEMKGALESGQFEVWLQPQYNHTTGVLVSAEALVRWRHPRRGLLIAPGEFVPVFERNGFIYEMDKFVWDTACRYLRGWLDEGRTPPPISVNVSRYDLSRPDVADVLTAAIRKYDLPARLLRLEITESAFAEKGGHIVSVVKRLAQLGFTVEIDEFGSGYSSLNTLKDVPADILKLDMAFLENDGGSRRGGNIIESVVRMAKWLGMAVIAKGVETARQADYLKSIGCSYVQGFLYAKPMPAEDYGRLTFGEGGAARLIALETVEDLDNNAFWDPESIDTLIFNSYAGSASIIEHTRGGVELLRATERFMRMLGSSVMTVEDAMRLPWREYMDGADAEAFAEAVEKSAATRDEVSVEYTLYGLPGCPERTTLRTALRVIAMAGERRLAYCVNENLTAQREAERGERLLAERLRIIMGSINGGVSAVVVGPGDAIRFVFSNDQYYRILGYTREQLETELPTAFDVVHPDDRERVRDSVGRALQSGQPASYRYRCLRRDGTTVHVRCNAAVTHMPDVEGEVLLSVITDITEVVRAEEQLRDVGQRLTTIMENASSGIVAAAFRGREVDVLFANDRYYRMLGYTRKQYDRAFPQGFGPIAPEDRERVLSEAVRANETGRPATIEYRVTARDGAVKWLKQRVTSARFANVEGPVQLSVIDDVTAEKLAEERMRETDEQLRFLGDISRGLLTDDRADDAAKLLLRRTREFFSGDAARAVEIDEARRATVVTYLSCAEGVAYPESALAPRSMDARPLWRQAYEDGGPLTIPDVSALDDRYRAEREMLGAQGVRSLLSVPLKRDGRVIGFLCVDNPRRRFADAEQLRAIGDCLAVILTRRDLNAKIASDRRELQILMHDTPGGFARMRVEADGTGAPVYTNDGFCELFGMTRDDVAALYRGDMYAGLHPDDAAGVRAAIEEARAGDGRFGAKYRLRHKDGRYVWVQVSGRFTTDDSGVTYLNAYYNDLSAEEKRALNVRETMPFVLKAIMQASQDMAFAKDRDFKYICCSQAFTRFAGRADESEIVGKTDAELFGEEIAARFYADDRRILDAGESAIDYIEELPAPDGDTLYLSMSKYLLRDAAGEVVGLYGTGRDVTETRAAFQQLKLLTDSIPGGIARYLCAASGDVRMTYFNDGFARTFGYTREEYEALCQKKTMALVFEEDAPQLRAQIAALVKDGTPIDCTYRARTRTEEGFKWLNLRGTPTERRGDAVLVNAVLFDITRQKAAEEAARIHEEEMRVALSNIGKVICEYDPERRTLTCPKDYTERNRMPAVVRNVPQNPENRARFDPRDLPAYDAFYAAILRGEPTGTMENRVFTPDGGVRWERAEFSSIFGADGKPVMTILSVEDTTEQRQRYELEQSRPSLGEDNLLVHALFNLNTGETLDYAYQDGREVPVSERTAFLFGQDNLEEYIINDEERARYRAINDPAALLKRFERGERELSIDYRRRMPTGEKLWARNILRMVRQPGGTDVLLFEYFYNIDEEMLRETMNRALIDLSYDYVARVTVANGHFVLLTNSELTGNMPPPRGDSLDQIVIAKVNEYVHPEDRELAARNLSMEGMLRNLQSADSFQFTCRYVQPDGSVRYKKLRQYYLDRDMGVIVLTREDVSQPVWEEMQKNELLAGALSAANQANAAKSQFLSRMSHELRTPMNAIIGLAALAAADVDNPKAMEDAIGKIGMSARYLLSLINDVLEMSRIESGRLTLSEEPFDFERFVSEVNAVIYPQAAAKGLDYDAVVGNYTEPTYVGDVTKLQEILVNVLGNAVKFTPAGGKVTLSISQTRTQGSRATLRFVVTDTGVGIDAKFLPHLFEPFSQEMANLTSSSAGTGLGLAITKNIVEMMGGHVGVQSVKGMGSVFTIDVQVGVSDQSRQYQEMVASMNLGRMKALVVDDDITVCQSTQSILTTMGMTAEWVDSGQLAVRRVAEKHDARDDFDTIFMDWKMPEMDGIEATRRIRGIVGPEVTIIIMTAYDWRSIETEAREAGVSMFMEKPLFQSSIVKAFEQVFLHHRDKVEYAPPSLPDLGGARILLAEDHPLNVEVARRLLERVGAEVVVAVNGLEAMEMFTTAQDHWFDAILMDIRMPVMDGLTATKNIRNLRKAGSKDIPIIAMTANAFDEDVELSLSSGMDAHLAKPIEPRLLYATLKRLMNR